MEEQELTITELVAKYQEDQNKILELQGNLLSSFKKSVRSLDAAPNVNVGDKYLRYTELQTNVIFLELSQSEDFSELNKVCRSFSTTKEKLKLKGKELFTNLDFNNIDLSTLAEIEKFVKGDITVRNRLNQPALALDKITRDTSIKDLLGNLGMFLTNVLISSQKFKNYGDIVDYVIEREYGDDPSRTPRIRHLGDKSYQQLKNLVEAKGNLIKR